MAAVVEVITVSSTIFPQPLRLEFKRPGRHFFFSNMQNARGNEFPPRRLVHLTMEKERKNDSLLIAVSNRT